MKGLNYCVILRSPVLIGHSGATSACLFRSEVGPLYLAGSFNQLDNQRRPVQVMLEIVNIVNKALPA